jgi:hypothetical protein
VSIGADQRDQHPAALRAGVPAVPVAAQEHPVAGLELNVLVVKAECYRAVDDHVEVERGGSVHVVGEARGELEDAPPRRAEAG